MNDLPTSAAVVAGVIAGVVAALLAGFVAFLSSERKLLIGNIFQERAKWREEIRVNALRVRQAVLGHELKNLDELHLVFKLLLNPHDEEDQLILLTIENLKSAGNPKAGLAEFSSRIVWMLKHDWERAKHEARSWFLPFRTPKRLPYALVRITRHSRGR